MNLFMYHASLYIYDGGTRSGTKSKHYVVGERIVNGDDIYYSTSNALVIHTDKITRLSTLNMTFVMFRQSPNRCGCRPVAQGQTVCTLSTDFYLWPDSLTRLCKISCEQSHGILTTEYSTITKSSLELQCGLNQDQADPIWKAFGAKLVDLNSVTCSGINPSRQLMSSFTFNYKMSCVDIDLEFIQSQVFEHIVNSTNTSYGGECFKSRNVNIGNANCTVRRLNVSCSNLGHQTKSRVTLDVEDNYLEVRENQTLTQQVYSKLFDYFSTQLPKTLELFLTEHLNVNNESATNFSQTPDSFNVVVDTCPDNAVLTFGRVLGYSACVTCPKHYQEVDTFFYKYCSKCPKEMRRELSEETCAIGERNYSKPSFEYCQHTCAIGKFFSNRSGICEWCPYGTYQNSTRAMNPVCRSCPNGKSTGYVGARSEADCIHLCPAGDYFRYPACTKCAIGYFMPNETNRINKCYKCSVGKTTLNLSTKSEDGCVDKCSSGQYFNISQAGCALCPNNMYQNEEKSNNTRSCKKCPIMTVTANIGSKKHSDCLGPCGSGQFINIWTSECAPCPKNTYHEIKQHVSFTCKPCGEYKITQNTGSGNISECIYDCGQGEFFNTTINQCMVCPIDTYQDQVGQDFCMPCPGKTFTVKNGSKECISPCFYGQLLNKSAEKCQDCPKGYYQNISEYKSETCFPCPLDFYNNKFGRRNCTACAGKTITLITGASHPLDCINPCEHGTFLNKSSKSCRECSKGFYQDQQDYRLHDCLKCPSANLTTIGNGATSLEQCVGYCASFPCLNGGECINIDGDFNCTCPKYLSGKRCEVIIDGKDTDSVEASVRFPNLVWNQNLSNTESQEFIELARIVEDNVRKGFKSDGNFRTVKVKEFRAGSVISTLELYSIYGLNLTAPVDTLSAIIANGKLGNLSVDRSSLEVVNFTCTQPLGMEDGRIPDDAITSGNKENERPPYFARLNKQGPGWVPQIIYLSDVFLQVDFRQEVELTAIASQGSSYDGGSWLNGYRLNYSPDGKKWLQYKGDNLYRKVSCLTLYSPVSTYKFSLFVPKHFLQY